jgi:hypothetical protein
MKESWPSLESKGRLLYHITGCAILTFVAVIIIIICSSSSSSSSSSSRDRDSAVGIATCYGLDGPGIESRWGEIFRTRPDRPWVPPNFLYDRYRIFPGGKAAGAWR